MFKSRVAVTGLMAAAMLQASCGRGAGREGVHPVHAHLFRQGSDLTLAFENVSERPICMPQITFSDGSRSGVHLYLYDPVTRELDESFALVTRAPGAKVDCGIVMPGESRAGTFRLKFVTGYFTRPPDCFYLVAVYRLATSEGMIASGPSRAVRVCKADYAADPGARHGD